MAVNTVTVKYFVLNIDQSQWSSSFALVGESYLITILLKSLSLTNLGGVSSPLQVLLSYGLLDTINFMLVSKFKSNEFKQPKSD